MFSIFKPDPIKKLDKRYRAMLEKAMLAQRNGDIKAYSKLTYEADQIHHEILQLKKIDKASGWVIKEEILDSEGV